MNDFLKNLVPGIIAAALFAFLLFLIKKYLIPFVQNLFRDIPILKGDWFLYYSDVPDAQPIGILTTKQFGEKLKGTTKIWKNRSGQDVDRNLNFHGAFRGGQILIFYEDPKLKGYVVGVVLLKLIGQNTFTGKAMYCHPSQEKVESYDLCLRK